MSDTSFAHVSQKSRRIDIINKDWVEDSLSDDGQQNWMIFIFLKLLGLSSEIAVPKGFELPKETDDGDEAKSGDTDTWSDLGIEHFVEQMLSINATPLVIPQSQNSNLGVRTAQ